MEKEMATHSSLLAWRIRMVREAWWATIHSVAKRRTRLSMHTLCNAMDCNMPGFPVHHQLLELAQTHVHRVGNAIQPSHPLSCPSPPAFNLAQHQGLFQ